MRRRRSACCASTRRDAGCVPPFRLDSADGALPAQPPLRTKRTKATMSSVRILLLRCSGCWCRANRFLHRPDPLRRLRAHRPCLSPHRVLDLSPPEQDADCAGDRSQNEDLTGPHFFSPLQRFQVFDELGLFALAQPQLEERGRRRPVPRRTRVQSTTREAISREAGAERSKAGRGFGRSCRSARAAPWTASCSIADHRAGSSPEAVVGGANPACCDLNLATRASYDEVRMILLNCAR